MEQRLIALQFVLHDGNTPRQRPEVPIFQLCMKLLYIALHQMIFLKAPDKNRLLNGIPQQHPVAHWLERPLKDADMRQPCMSYRKNTSIWHGNSVDSHEPVVVFTKHYYHLNNYPYLYIVLRLLPSQILTTWIYLRSQSPLFQLPHLKFKISFYEYFCWQPQ